MLRPLSRPRNNVSVARFDGDRGEYMLAVGEGHTVEGPPTLNNYTWMEVDDWPAWERVLMEGPFIHHAAIVYGHYADAVLEAVRFASGLGTARLSPRHLDSPSCVEAAIDRHCR